MSSHIVAAQERRSIYEERRWQAHTAFSVALGSTTASAIISVVGAVSLCLGNLSAGAATTAVGLTSGAVSVRAFKLSKDANDRLDKAARALEDEYSWCT